MCFFKDTAPPEIYTYLHTLSLHDALPICIRTLRQGGGLSGFTKRAESAYDPFGAAHSSTSISAALGFAVANKLADRPDKAIAVIGDGAMSAGMAYRSEEHTSELQSLMRISYAVFCLKKQKSYT